MLDLIDKEIETNDGKNVGVGKFPRILNGEFYKVVKEKSLENNNVMAKWMIKGCTAVISGTMSSTGNFLSHIRRVHPSKFESCKEYLRKKDACMTNDTDDGGIQKKFTSFISQAQVWSY